MAYYQSNLIKVDDSSVKFNSNAELTSITPQDMAIINDSSESEVTTYSSHKIAEVVQSSQYSLPIATDQQLGGIKPDNSTITVDQNGVATAHVSLGTLSLRLNNLTDGQILKYSQTDGALINTNQYALPIATTERLGGIKVGSNLSITPEGVLSTHAPYELSPATTAALGGVKIDGTSITINNTGVISSNIPTASTSVLGGVKVDGTSITIDANGVITATAQEGTTYNKASASADGLMSKEHFSKLEGIAANANNYSLPTASTTTLGGVKIDGTSITINNEVISATLPTASTSVLGGVKVDGSTITIDNNGVISSSGGSSNISDLDDLSDVTLTSPLDGDILTYDATNSRWVNGDFSVLTDNETTYRYYSDGVQVIKSFVKPSTSLYIPSNSSSVLPLSMWEYDGGDVDHPTFSYDTTNGEVSIMGTLRGIPYTYKGVSWLTGTNNTESGGSKVLQNIVYLLKGCPKDSNVSVGFYRLMGRERHRCLGRDFGDGAIIDLRDECLDTNYYTLDIRIQTDSGLYVGTHNFNAEFTPELIPITDYYETLQIGNGLKVQNGALQTYETVGDFIANANNSLSVSKSISEVLFNYLLTTKVLLNGWIDDGMSVINQDGVRALLYPDGRITLNGTATDDTWIVVNDFSGILPPTNIAVKAGSYFTACEEYISGVSVLLYDEDGNTIIATDNGRYNSANNIVSKQGVNPGTDILINTTSTPRIEIAVTDGTVCNNVKIYPMCCYKS